MVFRELPDPLTDVTTLHESKYAGVIFHTDRLTKDLAYLIYRYLLITGVTCTTFDTNLAHTVIKFALLFI